MNLARLERGVGALISGLPVAAPLLLLTPVLWSRLAPDRLYHCWDHVPILCFIPPFVHSSEFPNDPLARDYYIWPAWAVYVAWVCFIASAFLLPAILGWRASAPEHPDSQ